MGTQTVKFEVGFDVGPTGKGAAAGSVRSGVVVGFDKKGRFGASLFTTVSGGAGQGRATSIGFAVCGTCAIGKLSGQSLTVTGTAGPASLNATIVPSTGDVEVGGALGAGAFVGATSDVTSEEVIFVVPEDANLGTDISSDQNGNVKVSTGFSFTSPTTEEKVEIKLFDFLKKDELE